ncbi:SLC13 family permease [Mangrovivirga cuniculi]|uniref:SLC13 family permease n=1 Tax=Mangrovivirga cuniculi TaxID=2715131 RepID=A0A4D7JRN6_9BACT|nr:SLC13 family permease [Mangrovivirga cuniculi]QCK16190.1 SLC13 family permease [Mangrovivirga cuniculi]
MIPLPYQPYIVFLAIVFMFIAIYRNWLRPVVSFAYTIIFFVVTGIISGPTVIKGLSNDKIASIVLLILITTGIRKNFNIELIFKGMFRDGISYRTFISRMMFQVAFLSSFINNTPVVALMTPYVIKWGKRHKIAPSKLLIPMSFATIMGGMITIIGTSTTLLLIGFLQKNNEPLLKSTDLLIIGTVITIIGILFLTFFAGRLLPNYKDLIDSFKEKQREYLIETKVKKNSEYLGKSIKKAGLRNMKGVFLVEIIRENQKISPVEPEEVILSGDVLIFAGNTDHIIDLAKSNNGLKLPQEDLYSVEDEIEVTECVVSNYSSMVGKTVKEASFRNRYDAAVVAIHRQGQKLSGKIGDIPLQAGDVLLLFSGKDFKERVELYRDLFIISSTREVVQSDKKKYYVLGIIGALIAGLLIYGQISLFTSLLIIFSILVGSNMLTLQDVKRELDLNMVAILVMSIALGEAVFNSGAGNIIANFMINNLLDYGTMAILAGLMIACMVLTNVVFNAAAVSIAFPIAFEVSQQLGISGMPFYLGIAFSASCAFLTPISYQTHLIIFGPGGYQFKDFFKVGLPVTLIYLTTAFVLITLLYPQII